MNVLFLYHMLRVNGLGFLRSRYFVQDLEKREHNVRLAYFIVEDKNKWEKLRDDTISFDEVSEFRPDVLIFELGGPDRFPSRDWLNELKRKGCIVVHCGLDYNDYIQHTDEYDEFLKGGGFRIFKGAAEKHSEYPSIRGSDRQSAISRTAVETLEKYCSIGDSMIFENVQWVESRMSLIISLFKKILLTSGADSFVKAYNDDRHGENNAVYGAFNDSGGIEILITGHFVTDGKDEADGAYNRIFLLNVLEYLYAHSPVRYKTEFTQTNRASVGVKSTKKHNSDSVKEHAKPTSILFLAADPTDASRLRLGEEFREIQEKLKLAQQREHFKLELPQLSARPADIAQALLDTQPQIVHFSGHGASTGSLYFENQTGQIQPVQPHALAALFEQFSSQVNCVLLNACYSETQAKAIAEHIEYVIGMNQAIGDKAAIAFAIGFYQALGAGRAIEDAYKLGCVQIRLQSISEHLTPVLIKKGQAQQQTAA